MQDEEHRKYHEVANIFPMMLGEEFDELKADIATNGLIEPIVITNDGSVLDGRNRHRACIETGTPMRFKRWTGGESLAAMMQFVASKNLHRRHLTSSQRAACSVAAEELVERLEREARERQAHGMTAPGKTLVETFPQALDGDQPKTRDTLARTFGTNPRYVQDAKKIHDEAPDLHERVKAGEVSIPKAKEELDARKYGGARQDVAVTVFSSETNEYYTPPQYIEAARQAMGSIDLDPASCEAAQRTIKADKYYTEENDGLLQDWHGNVWLNPPYGKIGNESSQGVWGQYLIEQHRSGNVKSAVLLVKAAVGYEWFEKLWDRLPACFARERISFIKADGSDDGQSKQGTAFFYIGNDLDSFIREFSQFGRIILPESQI